MATILNFEAAQCSRDPRYRATLAAAQACDALRAHVMGEEPLSAGEVAEALETIQSVLPQADREA
jgi:hypothetical protein